MAHMYVRIVDKANDKTIPCDSFDETGEYLVIAVPDKPIVLLKKDELICPTKVYLMNAEGKTIDSRVYRTEIKE